MIIITNLGIGGKPKSYRVTTVYNTVRYQPKIVTMNIFTSQKSSFLPISKIPSRIGDIAICLLTNRRFYLLRAIFPS